MNTLEFNRGAVKPFECLKEGWALIKDRYFFFFGIVFVGLIIAGFGPLGILLGPMLCGIYISLFKQMRREEVTFDLLFKGFDHFMPSAIVSVLQTLPTIIISLVIYIPLIIWWITSNPMFQRRGGEPDFSAFFILYGIEIGAAILLGIVSAFIKMFLMFSYPLIVDRKLTATDAIKTSIRAVLGNLSGMVGLILLQGALSIIGLMAFVVGIYFVFPLYYAADVIAYRQVFPMQESFSEGPPPPPQNWQ